MFEGGVVQLFLLFNALIFGAVIMLAVQHFRAHQHQKNQTEPTVDLLPEAARKRLADNAEHEYQKVLAKSAQAFEGETAAVVDELRISLSKLSQEIMSAEMDRYKTQLADLRAKAHSSIGTAIDEINNHQIEVKQQLAERKKLIDQELSHQSELVSDTFTEHQKVIKQSFESQHTELSQKQAELSQQLIAHQQDVIAMLDAQVKAYADSQADFEAKLTEELTARREAMVSQFDQTVADTLLEFITESLGESVDIEAQRMQLLSSLEAHKKELVAELSK